MTLPLLFVTTDGRIILGFPIFVLLTFASILQSDLEAVPARFLRVGDHSQIRVGSQEGRFYLLSITPIHSSALTARTTDQPSVGRMFSLLYSSMTSVTASAYDKNNYFILIFNIFEGNYHLINYSGQKKCKTFKRTIFPSEVQWSGVEVFHKMVIPK